MPKFAWSYSALKEYENCPRKYHETKVLKRYPFEESEEMLYGKKLHKACENYIKRNAPLPKDMEFLTNTLESLKRKQGDKYPEFKMALTEKLEPVDYFDKNVWVRGAADLLIVDKENSLAWVVDYKTGKDKYPDTDQLALMSLMVMAYFPEITRVNSALIFVMKGSIIKETVYRQEKEPLWWDFRTRTAAIAGSMDNNVWNPKQSGLCGYCPVSTCEFNT
ncbi:MAG TPA: PD-(D/E)XK nuclease family protein [Ferrovaceae bacterium]|jgi:hypothetical protein|nr:PD-(D/E)XK nuclease family protein [Ferrovaceae bacterium]